MKILSLSFILVVSSLSFSQENNFSTKTFQIGEDIVWGFDFLSENRLLVAEKKGRLVIFDLANHKIEVINNVPDVSDNGQGGLMDVLIDKNFTDNNTIYLTYAVPLKGGQTTRLISAQLKDLTLTNIKQLFTALPATRETKHFGSRVVQDAAGNLFLTVGDRGERDLAQDKEQKRGKVYKIHPDSTVELWSFGHRNAQGADFHPVTQTLWTAEHGPRGGDELNEIKPGLNYGWPVITYGKEYWGPSIGEGEVKEGMEQPKYFYTPSIAASGLMIYSGKMFPEWENNFFVGALKDTHISRLDENNGQVTEAEKYFQDNGERIRQIKEATDGSIFYSTDNGKVIRIYR